MCDEDPETSVVRTMGLERSVQLARAWDTGDSDDFENWFRNISDGSHTIHFAVRELRIS
jgi:hypothetical protein